jgi:hypothetical protein
MKKSCPARLRSPPIMCHDAGFAGCNIWKEGGEVRPKSLTSGLPACSGSRLRRSIIAYRNALANLAQVMSPESIRPPGQLDLLASITTWHAWETSPRPDPANFLGKRCFQCQC